MIGDDHRHGNDGQGYCQSNNECLHFFSGSWRVKSYGPGANLNSIAGRHRPHTGVCGVVGGHSYGHRNHGQGDCQGDDQLFHRFALELFV